jgi:hypothetical protein
MPLYDVTHIESLVKPTSAYEYEPVQALEKKLPANTFDRIVKTVDEAIEHVRPTQKSKLVWTRMAALFGNNSLEPKKHIDHMWDKIIQITGEDLARLAIGGLLRWRISLRDETWLVYRRDSGDRDPLTNKLITISEYWIDNNYRPKNQKPKDLVSALTMLQQRFQTQRTQQHG